MSESVFRAEIHPQPGVTEIDLHGEIDSFAEEGLEAAYQTASETNPSTIMLNFSDIQYINSTGIALLIDILAKAQRAKIRLVVYGLNEHYQEIFKITRLADFMDIFPDQASAIKDTVRIIVRK
jgi:anti-anti-sigma factor